MIDASVALGFLTIGILLGRVFRPRQPHSFVGGRFMFIVKDDNPDVGYTITAPTVTDAEGSPVPAGSLTFTVTSDNANAVAVTPDPTNPLAGTVHFGSPKADGTPDTANINVAVTDAAGTLLGSFGAQFTVTAGDPAKIVGGSIAFAGLTEAQPAPPPAQP
jgi:hypothetical protein